MAGLSGPAGEGYREKGYGNTPSYGHLSGNRSDNEPGSVFTERVAGAGVVGSMRP